MQLKVTKDVYFFRFIIENMNCTHFYEYECRYLTKMLIEFLFFNHINMDCARKKYLEMLSVLLLW